ncbi:argininosuccinate synthase [Dysgonomonas sp. PFB1-18]|uniref:argininosuccinate synthase n=1 Tax=unclassified Dysgonomonas TaxID=2630389 RepID=UPI0024755B39|nr:MULTISPECIES: argininosuccinate synthase domain-containing protein [unclassified Dysgonomonas]MDH6308623.1 argininosuccinate synthase [Dysgonomonas sp. PF1-14]MDH6338124.1 argininosuccinate synthase [Dysgonomonas sp. PF1-16]MDH6379621.1 argininosuccinate synthase [Dysgonomonas sp. PFB1-18]MDH6396951.1 argininosuccinate synthase [Dysgonomonas sp. PF1-23]
MKKKVVLAFSGGLDTSFCAKYLSADLGYEVYTAIANTGGFTQEELAVIEEKAYKLGAAKHISLDITQEYYEKSIKYMIFGNVLRNGTYPISVSSERIFQAIAIINYAKEIGADAVAHGSTGAGNDQVRFDLTFDVLAPGIEIITPTRDMLLTREYEINYLKEHGYEADFTKMEYSINKGLWGTSIGGKETLKSEQTLPEEAYPSQLKKEGKETLTINFEEGEIAAINGVAYTDKVKAIQKIEEITSAYAIGRDMHIGDTIIGIKGRVGFEAAAPLVIINAHKMLEKHTLTKWQQYWKEQVGNWYGMFLHEAQYLEPVMRDIEAMLESSQRNVTGKVIIELHPYRYVLVGVESNFDLMKADFGEYGEVNKAWTSDDAKGFTKIYAMTNKIYHSVQNRNKTIE